MYNILPFVLIIISLVVIIIIVVRKFPVIANLDVDTIPEEKEAKFKEQIVGTRIKRNFVKWTSKVSKFFRWINRKIIGYSSQLYNKLVDLRDSYDEEDSVSKQEKNEKISKIFEELNSLNEKEDFLKYETKLIDIIELDSKNTKAFEKLGDIYYENKRDSEAKRTYEHMLKILGNEDNETRAEINFNLANVSKNKDDLEQALFYIKEALRIIPNNPRFLDTMLEISIIKKDKVLANSTFKKLEKVNPENRKLDEWKKKMAGLE